MVIFFYLEDISFVKPMTCHLPFFLFFIFLRKDLSPFFVNNAAQKCEIKLYLLLKFRQAMCHANNAVVKNRPRILQSP